MDVQEGSYYRLNRICLSLVGLWPTQDPKTKIFAVYFVYISYFMVFAPQVCKVLSTELDMESIVRIVESIAISGIFCIKYSMHLIHKEEIEDLMSSIYNDWREIKCKKELEILHEYTVRAKHFNTIFVVSHYLIFSIYFNVPLIWNVWNFMIQKNVSRSLAMPYLAEYYVSEEKYWFPLNVQMMANSLISVTSALASDVTFRTFILHVCGTFAIVGQRLYHSCDECDRDSPGADQSYEKIVSGIKGHLTAIKSINTVNNCYATGNLLSAFLVTITISLLLCETVIVFGEWDKMLIYMNLCIGVLLMSGVTIYPGQILLDHSTTPFEKAYDSAWYHAPIKSQKLILLLMRCNVKPSPIMLGQFYVVSFETYASLLHVSFSYFTVLQSLR